jgi:pyruvate dehydrogenase E1 component alpha subunit
MDLPREKQVEMYRLMETIRLFEEEVSRLYAEGTMPGFVHLYIGQEAVAAGVCAALNEDDFIISNHRGHGHLIAKGARLDKIMAELFAKKTGYCKGKGGSMHIADVEKGILGTNGIVGAGLTIATGAGLSAKLRETRQVVVCFFGDGAANRGTFHEALNLSSVLSLPIIFLCENNQVAQGTILAKHSRVASIAVRAKAYGIVGASVDGNDIYAVHNAATDAVEKARAGDGPILLECHTYRWVGHFEGEPGTTYRSAGEVEEWKKKDPIKRMQDYMLKEGIITSDDVDRIREEINQELEKAVGYALESPEPSPDDVLKDVYFRDGGCL